jgi:hypothetical protein
VARCWQSRLSDGLGLHARCSGQGAQEQEGQGLLRLAPYARPREKHSYEAESEAPSMHSAW